LRLWIGNIAPGTSDDELRDFVSRYGISTVASIEHIPGDGSRPAVVLEVDATPDTLMKVTQRLDGVQWKGRSLNVQAITR
jgi:RNA recognition motif-containing protein